MTDLTPYLDAFNARPRTGGDTARRAAMARFGALGLPTRRQENWRFTNFRPLEKSISPPVESSTISASVTVPAAYVLGIPSHRLVLVNGRYAPELSEIGVLPAGISLRPVSELLATSPSELRG